LQKPSLFYFTHLSISFFSSPLFYTDIANIQGFRYSESQASVSPVTIYRRCLNLYDQCIITLSS